MDSYLSVIVIVIAIVIVTVIVSSNRAKGGVCVGGELRVRGYPERLKFVLLGKRVIGILICPKMSASSFGQKSIGKDPGYY